MKYKMLTVLFFFLAVNSVFAKEQTADQGFVVIDANVCQFRLRGYKLRKPIEEAIVFGVSLMIDTYQDIFGFEYPDDFKMKVVIIAGKKKFEDYQVKMHGKVFGNQGYSDYGRGEIVVWENEKTTTMIGVLFHEASHFMVAQHIPRCPPWLDEGLAQYFQGMEVIGQKKRIVFEENVTTWSKHWLENGFPMTLKEYVSLNFDEWMAFNQRDSYAAYTIGYSLVYYMMSRHKTQEVLKELLWEFKRQGEDADSVKTIDEHYPGGFAKFEKMWKKWIPRARPYRPLRAFRKMADKKARSAAQK